MFLSLPIGSLLSKSIGVSNTVLVGGSLMALGVHLSSFTTSLTHFLACFSVLLGGGLGLAYAAPLEAAWKWYPKSKGLVTGVIVSGYGCGGFILNIVGTRYVNPHNHTMIRGLFPDEVYHNFPVLLRTLAMAFLVITLMCYFLITEPKTTANRQVDAKVEEVPGLEVSEAIRTVQFSVLWSMVFCSACAGLNASALYKQFAFSRSALAGLSYQLHRLSMQSVNSCLR
jgi:MFS transporter, OFA family, oxalate/formate antiporter